MVYYSYKHSLPPLAVGNLVLDATNREPVVRANGAQVRALITDTEFVVAVQAHAVRGVIAIRGTPEVRAFFVGVVARA